VVTRHWVGGRPSDKEPAWIRSLAFSGAHSPLLPEVFESVQDEAGRRAVGPVDPSEGLLLRLGLRPGFRCRSWMWPLQRLSCFGNRYPRLCQQTR
jgi:hypothetical protein